MLPEKLGAELLALQEQRLQVGSQELVLIEPADVDAVMDMYINRGMLPGCQLVRPCRLP